MLRFLSPGFRGAAVLAFALAAVTPAVASDATALRVTNASAGSIGYMRVPHHADFVMQTFTLEAWVDREGIGYGQTTDPTGSGIVSKPRENVCGSNIASWHMDYSNSGQVMFNVAHTYSSSGLYLQSPILPDPLVRHHLAVTFDADSALIYIDGVRRTAADWNLGTVYYGTEQVLIGANNWACGYMRGFDGFIDDVRIWNYARSAGDIATWKDCRLSGSEPGLVGYWTFDGSNLVDQTGHGHDGTTTGTAVSYAALASLAPCTVGVDDEPSIGSAGIAMSLFPLPARDRVSVSFELPRPGPVTVDVWDVAGRRLGVWTDREYSAGRHEIGGDLSSIRAEGRHSGVRFVRLRSNGATVVRTLITLD